MFETSNKPTFGSPTANMMEMATRRIIHKPPLSPLTPCDKENSESASNIMEQPVSENKPKSRTNNGVKVNSRAIFNFGGLNKVVFRNQKDSDDEYSAGTRTPMTPLSVKSTRSILSPNIFSPYREFFNKSNKPAGVTSPDSDDEHSKATSPMRSPVRQNNLNTIAEEAPAAESVAEEPQQQTEAEEDAGAEGDLDILCGTGLLVHKVCANDIANQHKRALFLDPTRTFLFWTEKTAVGADDHKKANVVRSLTRTKSWIKKNKQKPVTPETKRTVLLSNIREISVGSGEFSSYVQINTVLGRTSKVLIFNIRDEAARLTFLNSMRALKV
jgi:hypothetical protein